MPLRASLRNEGDTFFKNQQFEGAIEKYSQALRSNGDAGALMCAVSSTFSASTTGANEPTIALAYAIAAFTINPDSEIALQLRRSYIDDGPLLNIAKKS